MFRGSILRALLLFSSAVLFAWVHPSAADSSHARVVRLSLVEGDVRFAREVHGDPLADQKAVWERATANLPIRHGYVVATDSGRAEVEFENGAMVFLNENTVLEFYDLSLEDGARTTRLVLRQGSASFYFNPAGEDYFSVTGGDFTVQSAGKSSFRLNNFDDGSNVAVLSGHVSVLQKEKETPLAKGQSLTMNAGEETASLGRVPVEDDFDHWVSGRIETVSSATSASMQYTAAPYYMPGFADLYTYGSWSNCGGYGFGWRPFGASFGWSPFTMGQWMWDPGFGWTWISSQPWGWAPYHYGGWLFDASCGGWFFSPPIYYNYFQGPGFGGARGVPRKRVPPIVHPPRPVYRASTAMFVRQNGKLGVVPMNPLDKEGKTPLNLQHGVFSADLAKTASSPFIPGPGQKLENVKSPSRESLSGSLLTTTAPIRATRSILEGNSSARSVSPGGQSSIVYDPAEHRFVNSERAVASGVRTPEGAPASSASNPLRTNGVHTAENPGSARAPMTPARPPAAPVTARMTAPPSRNMAPPPAPRVSAGGGYRGGGTEYSRGSAGAGASSRGPSAPSASASRPSAPSGGGGRPH